MMGDELGVTEKLVVDKLRKAATDSLDAARKLVEELESLEGAEWERLMLHPKAKEGAIKILDPLEKLPSNLSHSLLLVMIAAGVTRADSEAWNR